MELILDSKFKDPYLKIKNLTILEKTGHWGPVSKNYPNTPIPLSKTEPPDRAMYKNIRENYDISKISKKTFQSIYCLFFKVIFHDKHNYYHGNDIIYTTSPIFFVQGSLTCRNNILLHFHLYWQCLV